FQLDFDTLGSAGEGAGHQHVILDMRRQHLEDTTRSLEPGIEAGIDQLLLARDAGDDLVLVQPFHRVLRDQRPIVLARPVRRDLLLQRRIAVADLVDVLAEPDIGPPFAQRHAARRIDHAHRGALALYADRRCGAALAGWKPFGRPALAMPPWSGTCGRARATISRTATRRSTSTPVRIPIASSMKTR